MAKKTKRVAGKGVGQEVRSFAAQKNASDIIPLSLIGHQLRSYENFRTEGIGQVLREVFPVNMEEAGIQLSIPEGEAFELEPPRIHNPNGGEETDPRKVLEQCRRLGRTWADSLRIRVQLYRHDTGEFKVQNLRIGNIPRMTDQATFLINGVEKVCVFQLIRSSGIFYRADGKDSLVASVKIIPSRGNWIEFTRDQKGKLYVRLGKTRKFHLATFLRAIGFEYRPPKRGKGKSPGRLVYFGERPQRVSIDLWEPVRSPVSGRITAIKEGSEGVVVDFACEGGGRHRETFAAGTRLQRKVGDAVKANTHMGDAIGHWAPTADILDEEGKLLLKKGRAVSAETIEKIAAHSHDGIPMVSLPVSGMPDRKMSVRGEEYFVLDRAFQEAARTGLLSREACIREIYLNFRPNDQAPPTEQALEFIWRRFFEGDYYDLSEVGRFQINQRLETKEIPFCHRTLTVQDILQALKFFLTAMEERRVSDDIDHLGIRRVRGVGEMLRAELKKGLLGMIKMAREKARTQDPDVQTPQSLIVPKLVLRPMERFFSTGELVQFLDQTNPFAELVHKRKLSAMGPGGLSRRRTGFEVRDVHKTHYGRICPIETPEGQNVGLINSLAVWADIDARGFLRTPYLKVRKGKILANKVALLNAQQEEAHWVAHASVERDEKGVIVGAARDAGEEGDKKIRVSARHRREPRWVGLDKVDMIDYRADQIVGVSASLIPFLEHDDATRALMGANMLRQATPLIRPTPPAVRTGMEVAAAEGSLYLAKALGPGKVLSVGPAKGGAHQIVVEYDSPHMDADGEERKTHIYRLTRYRRSNQSTLIDQSPLVFAGDRVKMGQTLCNGPSIRNGELALGQNFVVALMSLDGYNFEDSIVVSERIVKEGLLDSVHIEKFEAVARRTKLGEEVITADIPNVDAELLANLTEEGVVREGTAVNPGDILVGKLTPKPEKERTPEERLLWKIINQRGSDMRNTSLRMPAGERGVVVRVQSLSKEDANAELRPGVLRKIEVYVAVQRRLTVGDKLAGRHGNKGVISRLMPEEDMPYLADGTPVDVIMNPLGVPSRMNIGQLMELHLGWAGRQAGFRAEVPVFNGPGMGVIEDELAKAGCDITGKSVLYDGRTGRQMENDVVVGVMYVMKLIHLAEDKIHARSIGPYSLITQQPLGGRARSGGQRFGEMEVWALEAYGASRALQEMITIKSDDIEGRNNAYKKMIAGEPISLSLKPESINNLDKEIRGLGLYLEFLSLSERSELLPGGDEEETEGAEVPAAASAADGEGADGAAEAGAQDGEEADKPADDGGGEASKSEPAATPPAPDPDEAPVPETPAPDETPVTAPVAEASEESS